MIAAGADTFAGAIPTILKLNSSNSLRHQQGPGGDGQRADALRLGCAAIGFTIYPGSEYAFDQMEELRALAEEAKASGLAVVVWSYPRGPNLNKEAETAIDICAYAAHMAALMGASIIKVKPPTAHIGLEAAKKAYESIDTSTLAKRVAHIMQCAFAGRRMVLFSGGEAKGLDAIYEEIRGIAEGGASGSIIGRNTFQRQKPEALEMLGKIIDIYQDSGLAMTEGCRLYLVTPPKLDLARFPDLLGAALDAGDVAAVQLRLKDADDAEWRDAIEALRPIAQTRGVAFLLNDRADLVADTGCDGVHVGQTDMPARKARGLIGAELTLGVTCHASRDLAIQAGEDGVDYVAFGAFFPSDTKEVTHHADPEILRWWSDLMELPCCAIGGITSANCAAAGRGGSGFPGGGRRGVGPSGWAGGGRALAECGDRGGSRRSSWVIHS